MKVTESRFFREREECDDWDRIERSFADEQLVDGTRFKFVEKMELEKGSINPCIKMKIDGKWKHLFFQVGENATRCFKRLRYRWQCYRQNH